MINEIQNNSAYAIDEGTRYRVVAFFSRDRTPARDLDPILSFFIPELKKSYAFKMESVKSDNPDVDGFYYFLLEKTHDMFRSRTISVFYFRCDGGNALDNIDRYKQGVLSCDKGSFHQKRFRFQVLNSSVEFDDRCQTYSYIKGSDLFFASQFVDSNEAPVDVSEVDRLVINFSNGTKSYDLISSYPLPTSENTAKAAPFAYAPAQRIDNFVTYPDYIRTKSYSDSIFQDLDIYSDAYNEYVKTIVHQAENVEINVESKIWRDPLHPSIVYVKVLNEDTVFLNSFNFGDAVKINIMLQFGADKVVVGTIDKPVFKFTIKESNSVYQRI